MCAGTSPGIPFLLIYYLLSCDCTTVYSTERTAESAITAAAAAALICVFMCKREREGKGENYDVHGNAGSLCAPVQDLVFYSFHVVVTQIYLVQR